MKIRICNMRLTGIDKNYYNNQLQIFANQFNPEQVMAVEYGKQDIRGGVSITIVDHKHCVPAQQQFTSKEEMLGFVVGCNAMNNFTSSNVLSFHKKLQGAA